jgi:hypothetical protein
VVDEKLRAPGKQITQRLFSLVGVEDIFLVNAYPRQLPPMPRQLVAAAGQLLLCLQ